MKYRSCLTLALMILVLAGCAVNQQQTEDAIARAAQAERALAEAKLQAVEARARIAEAEAERLRLQAQADALEHSRQAANEELERQRRENEEIARRTQQAERELVLANDKVRDIGLSLGDLEARTNEVSGIASRLELLFGERIVNEDDTQLFLSQQQDVQRLVNVIASLKSSLRSSETIGNLQALEELKDQVERTGEELTSVRRSLIASLDTIQILPIRSAVEQDRLDYRILEKPTLFSVEDINVSPDVIQLFQNHQNVIHELVQEYQ